MIAAHLPELFKGLDVTEHRAFRVTRARDLEIDEDVTEDLLMSLERELLRRDSSRPVRLEAEESMSDDMLGKLWSWSSAWTPARCTGSRRHSACRA